jgi:tricorn protease
MIGIAIFTGFTEYTAQKPQQLEPSSHLVVREPTISKTKIVFQFAGDLWSVPRAGGQATRLTSSIGREFRPRFSPDGSQIAFTGQYDGNSDVYVIPAGGGIPKRLTAHPAEDFVNGWSADGKSVLFTSQMNTATSYLQLYSVSVEGGFPKQLPFPAVEYASMNPAGTHIAYVPNPKWQQAWKRYRGGQTTSIWLGNLSNSKTKELPFLNTNDSYPMWIGDSIYYLSDPKGPVGLFKHDTKSGKTTEEVSGEGFEIKSASAGAGVIVYEKFGSLYIFDPASKRSTRVEIQIEGDFPEVRTQFKDLRPFSSTSTISPSGQRIAGSARGFIYTAPAAKGDARFLQTKQGVERRNPRWSPDGKTIAYLSDEKGQEQLVLFDVASSSEKFVPIGDSPSIFDNLVWSPDSKKLLYSDFARKIWLFDVATGESTKVDQMLRRGRVGLSFAWSPDSQWVTYVKDSPSGMGTIRIYKVSSAKSELITDGLSDASSPVFDRNGKYLYFTAGTDIGLGADGQDIASYATANPTQNVYCAVLKKGTASPLSPESDEEKIATSTEKVGEKQGDKTTEKPAEKASERPSNSTEIDFDGLESRIVTLPFPKQPYSSLEPGPSGNVFAISLPLQSSAIDSPQGVPTLHRFSNGDRKVTTFGTGVVGIETTPDGSKMLLKTISGEVIASTAAPYAPGAGAIPTPDLRLKLDPMVEWKAMFAAAIRKQKICFYDPNLHGVNLDAVAKRYEPFLSNLKSRADLNSVFVEVMGEISVGHMFISGGERPQSVPSVPGGLLGADFTFESGKYKISRVYTGERWNPGLYAPLAQPGVEAKAGEYLLSIDGQELQDSMDLYVALEGKAGKQVKIKLSSKPDGKEAREVVVVPVASENQLRFRAWSEDNRKRVEEATGGRVGYVHVPDTNVGGWREFMRYYYAQTGKDAIIIDERFNGGGAIADFLVREMIKPIISGSRTRHGEDFVIPAVGVFGPKVMIANEMAGSGGDILPHLFRFHKVGPIIGKRTWGAMISNYNFRLVDGGTISSPDDAMYNPDGTWMIENRGTAPDIEVELDPSLWRQGKDAQLERAIQEILSILEKNPPTKMKRPDYPSIPPFKPAGEPTKKSGGS